MTWVRVTRHNRCPVCGKVDWCCIGETLINCMRVESQRPCRNGGWLHRTGDPLPYDRLRHKSFEALAKKDVHQAASGATKIDALGMLNRWQSHPNNLESISATLGVSRNALKSLGCVWAREYASYAFPMRDAQGRVIGIRLRSESGKKFAVKGSKQGLFMEGGGNPCFEKRKTNSEVSDAALPFKPKSAVLICEGPTDTAAAIDLGFAAIGRPACQGCEGMIAEAVRGMGRVYVIADNDLPGQFGAARLCKMLRGARIVTLPAKDLREFKNREGSKELLESILSATL